MKAVRAERRRTNAVVRARYREIAGGGSSLGLEADFERKRARCGLRRTEGTETNAGTISRAKLHQSLRWHEGRIPAEFRERESESTSVREEEEMQIGWVYSGQRTEKSTPFF